METTLMQMIGSRISEARRARSLTQADLADKLHIANSHMSSIERGNTNFSVDLLIRIASALQVSADWILFINTPETKHVHVEEIEDLFKDCSPDEVASIIQMSRQFKEALQSAKQSVKNE